MMSGKIVSTWLVTYQVLGAKGSPQMTRVALTEGYTTMNDIPKLIAIRRGLEPEDVKLMILFLVENEV